MIFLIFDDVKRVQQQQMRYLLAFLICITAVTAVPQLTSDQFFQALASNQFLFVKFFSPKCGHCIAMAPEYQLFYKHSEGKEYKVVQFNCVDNGEICESIGIEGYPTLQLFVSGISFTYSGARTATEMISWLQDLHTSTLPVLSEEQGHEKIGKQTFGVVSGLSKKTQRLIAIANKVHDNGIKFYSFLLRGFIGLFKKGLTQPLRYETDQHFPMSLIDWAFENGRSPIVSFQKQETMRYMRRQKKFKYGLAIVDEGYDFFGSSLAVVEEWCNKNFDEILCLSVNKDSPMYEIAQEKLKTNRSTIVIVRADLSIGYHFPHSTVNEQNLNQFYADAKGDKIYRDIDVERDRRERIKYTNVVKLTPANYRAFLTQNPVVFMEYYSPDCIHCVKFAEEYQRAATHFKSIGSSVVFAAVDLTGEENGLMRKEDIKGYPHFRFFIRKSMIMFRLSRSAENIIKFVTDLIDARFNQVASLDEIKEEQFVTISGVGKDSMWNVLSGLYSRLPIYHVSQQGNFSLAYHGKTMRSYSQKADIWQAFDWLEIQTSPVLVSLGEPTPTKKLEKALIKHLPILVVVNKHERESVQPILDLLTEFCEEVTEYVCGYLHKGDEDYQMLIDWFGDKDTETNRLFWVNTQKSLKYNYPSELSTLDKDQLSQFVRAARAGQLAAFGVAAEKAAASDQELSSNGEL